MTFLAHLDLPRKNVVAKHEATGELVARVTVNRHRCSLWLPLQTSCWISCSKYVPLVQEVCGCVVAVFVATFVQILRFLPDPDSCPFWLLVFLRSSTCCSFCRNYCRAFAPLHNGASNNKSSVAALLILENVQILLVIDLRVVHHFAGDAFTIPRAWWGGRRPPRRGSS